MVCTYPYRAGDEPVPGYRLVAFLGRGGFGEVWKATAPGGTEAAVKVINLTAATGRKEFRALRLVKRIRHPNLVPIFAFWLKNGQGQILDDEYTTNLDLAASRNAAEMARETMMPNHQPADQSPQPAELIMAMGLGQISLFDRLKECHTAGEEGIPDDELLPYMRDAARAIDYLNRPVHDLGKGPVAIQHCDIKPHNMLMVGGATQLCDFGLASMLGDMRATTAAAGTIAYAAPECLRDGKPSAATDQYSLAVSFYELKTGQLPFEDESFSHVSSAVMNGTLTFSEVEPPVRAVLKRATALDPAKRYPTTGAMVEALSHALFPDMSITTVVPPEKSSKSRLLILLLLVALLGGGAYAGWPYLLPLLKPAPTQHELAVAALAEAELLAQQGDVAKAKISFAQALQHDPEMADAYYGRGMVELSAGEAQAALDDFDAAAKRLPTSYKTHRGYAQAHFLRGKELFDQGEFAPSLAELTQVIETFGASAAAETLTDAQLLRAKARLKLQQIDEAVADFQELAASNAERFGHQPEFAEALFARGRRHLAESKFDEALADFDAAKGIDATRFASHAEYAQAYVGRGQARHQAGADDEAIADFTAAIDEHAKFPTDAYRLCADCWLKKNEADKVRGDLDQAVSQNPDNFHAWLDRGTFYLDHDDFEAAERDLSRAIEIQPDGADSALAYDRRGTARLNAGQNLTGAIADFSEEIKREPNALAYLNRGLAHREQEQLEEAIRDFDLAIKQDPQSADAYLYRGLAWRSQGELEKALEDLNQAVKIDGQSAEAFRVRGAVVLARGNFEQALHDFGDAIRLDPTEPSSYLARGIAASDHHVAKYADARADFQQAAKLAPEDAEAHRRLAALYATCPVLNIRDGQKAIDVATEACRLTEWNDAACLATLAAAYAEAGDFTQAKEWQTKAIGLAAEDDKASYRERLELYQHGKPFHEGTGEVSPP